MTPDQLPKAEILFEWMKVVRADEETWAPWLIPGSPNTKEKDEARNVWADANNNFMAAVRNRVDDVHFHWEQSSGYGVPVFCLVYICKFEVRDVDLDNLIKYPRPTDFPYFILSTADPLNFNFHEAQR